MIKYLILSSSCGKIGTLSFLRSAIVFEGKISDSKKKKEKNQEFIGCDVFGQRNQF